MSKHTITGFITYRKNTFDTVPNITFQDWCPTSSSDRVVIRPHSFEVEVPDDFDPRPGQVAALQEQKRAVQAAFAERVTDIERQISELLCLEAS